MAIWPFRRSASAEPVTAQAPSPEEAKGLTVEQLAERLDGTVGGATSSGARVGLTTAVQVSAVFGCMRVIAEGVAQLPLQVLRLDNGRRVTADQSDAQRLLVSRPNDWQTPFQFLEGMTAAAVLTGGGYALKIREGRRVLELLPLVPGSVTIEKDDFGSPLFRVTAGGKPVGVYGLEDMLVLQGPGWGDVAAFEPLRIAREAMGLAMVTEESQSRLHANGTRPSGYLTTEGKLSPEARSQLRENWQARFGGTGNIGRTPVLDGGLEWKSLAMSGVDAQHLETRRFQVEEVCRFLRVFPQMVMQADKASTYASAEQFFLAHVVHSLDPWLVRWEQAIRRDLVTDQERRAGVYAHFKRQALLRGAAKDRAEFYRTMVELGIYTRNEVRALEDLDPLPGLDEPLTPLNMSPGGARREPSEGA